jgi:ubiquinone/menaquinone biosynthesis C-methylase UbiE
MFDNIAPKYDLLNHVLSMKIDALEKQVGRYAKKR